MVRVSILGLALAGAANSFGQTAAMPPMETHEQKAGAVSTSLTVSIGGSR